MNLIITGAPGSGKGSQTPIVEKYFGIPTISTGNMLRAEVAAGSELGNKAKAIMEAGGLVSDDIIIDMLTERIKQDDCKNGFILDGVPRTLPQAQMMQDKGIKIDAVLNIDVADSEIKRRLAGRRVCLKCGATYHIDDKKPLTEGVCDSCGDEIVVRKDDSMEVVESRLKTYHEQTEPLLDFYKDKAKVETAVNDGTLLVPEMSEVVKEAISKL